MTSLHASSSLKNEGVLELHCEVPHFSPSMLHSKNTKPISKMVYFFPICDLKHSASSLALTLLFLVLLLVVLHESSATTSSCLAMVQQGKCLSLLMYPCVHFFCFHPNEAQFSATVDGRGHAVQIKTRL